MIDQLPTSKYKTPSQILSATSLSNNWASVSVFQKLLGKERCFIKAKPYTKIIKANNQWLSLYSPGCVRKKQITFSP